MDRTTWTSAIALLAGVFLAAPAMGQSRSTEIVASPTVVLNAPRGDAQILAKVAPGTVVEVVDHFGDWYLVTPPAATAATYSWRRGWIAARAFDVQNERRPAANGRFMVRAFGRAGGTLFNARDSFDTILDGTLSSVYGGGGQIVLPNGAFVQASVDRFRHNGTLALGTGSQVFRLEMPARLTLTPVEVTGGYRVENSTRVASYFGGGAGWYTFEEESPFTSGADRISKRSIGYHVLGGAELRVLRWVWVAGEVHWATVPKALGDTGVSALFEEKDLGGTTFSFKLIVGY
jgi:opacity protein-like surface antigen